MTAHIHDNAETIAKGLEATHVYLDALAAIDRRQAENPTPGQKGAALVSTAVQFILAQAAQDYPPEAFPLILHGVGLGVGASLGQIGADAGHVSGALLEVNKGTFAAWTATTRLMAGRR